MKLAKALVLRADLQKRMELLRKRLVNCPKVQEGDAPPEDRTVLCQKGEQVLPQLSTLMVQINRQALHPLLSDGISFTTAIARRDLLSLRQSVLDAASTTMERYSPSEVRLVTTAPIGQLRQEDDILVRQRRELDTPIQATNEQTDLVEM
ncbi:DIP1984 family protein [Ktedonospora formicarum]|uniref:Uncharacterized protein n=1 Tax=Ktedonospora formicarum TaxID=2778364 RepID=A0A8J3IBX8_9CHLR|nr:DIP1984 family protein [Ktedonospora formicarum]GHO51166.1 hypothetical protein KSX_93290 [Ktedonospora formicarum]